MTGGQDPSRQSRGQDASRQDAYRNHAPEEARRDDPRRDDASGQSGPQGHGDLRVAVRHQRRGEFHLAAEFTVPSGHTAAVMGPSGAGKSTLLALIAGQLRLDDGEISIGGRVLSSSSGRQHVRPADRGVVLLGQDPLLFPHLSVRENIAFGPRSKGVPAAVARADAEEWLERIGLEGMATRLPSELSGGQQQRVAVARALATHPGVLLLDEPLTSLDPITASEVRTVLQTQLAASDATTILVTHDALDATVLADLMLVIERGALTHEGRVRDVLAAPRTAYAANIAGVNRVHGYRAGATWSYHGVTLDAAGGLDAVGDTAYPMAESGQESAQDSGDESGQESGKEPGHESGQESRPESAQESGQAIALIRPADIRLLPADRAQSGDLMPRSESVAPGSDAMFEHPEAEATAPESSARTWRTRIARLEQTPAGARVFLEDPEIAVDVSLEEWVGQQFSPGTLVHAMVLRWRILPPG